MTYNQAIASDAGLYREWIAERFGAYLRHGGSFETATRCRWHIRQLARLAGLSFDECLADILADSRQ